MLSTQLKNVVAALDKNHNPEDFVSPDVPRGHMTVGNWWVHRDEPLELLENPILTVTADTEALQTACTFRGIPILYVEGPAALREVGFNQVPAFPVEELARFYSVNP